MYAVRPSFRTPHQPLRKGRRAICRVLELWTRSPYQTIQYYAAPSPQSGRETLYISAQEGMKPPGINPLTGPHLRILDFHAEKQESNQIAVSCTFVLVKNGARRPFKEVYAYGLW